VDFKNDAVEMRVDVTLLREGLNTVRGLCTQILGVGHDEVTTADLITVLMYIEEVCGKTLWKEEEAIDAGFIKPLESGWMPNGDNGEVEIVGG